MSFPISVIIPSFNGANRIVRLLRALEIQDESNFETIVVIDGSTDNTEAILNQNSWKLNLRIIKQENKGRAGARNGGAEEASGSILIFYDDDIEPSTNSISLHQRALITAPISVGGVLDPIDFKTEFGGYKAFISRNWISSLGNTPIILDSGNLFLTAANLAIKADVFHEIQGFDSFLNDAEDFDLAVRAFLKGYDIVYTPQNQVIHHAFDSCRTYTVRQREYRKAHDILIQHRGKNGLYKKYQVKKSPSKKLVYFFIPGLAAAAIDKGLFKFLPTQWRYALYARIISALSVYYPNRKLY